MKEDTPKKFEIEIYDKIVVGEPPNEGFKYEKVHYDQPVIIEAKNKQDLDSFAAKLKLINQVFKIVRVINDEPNKSIVQNNTTSVQHVSNNEKQDNAKTLTSETTTVNATVTPVKQQVVSKPKFYKIGDIEIKDDNGKIYQKQWIKLNESEASNFRIVNDKSNAIFQLKDKHIEMKRWVLVEKSDNNENSSENIENEISEKGEEN